MRLRPRWTTTRLNVWNGPGESFRLLTVLDTAVRVRVTGTIRGPWAEIQQRRYEGPWNGRRRSSPAVCGA